MSLNEWAIVLAPPLINTQLSYFLKKSKLIFRIIKDLHVITPTLLTTLISIYFNNHGDKKCLKILMY